MSAKASEEDIRQAIGQVKHPAIDRTLVDLGIVKDVVVQGNKVMLTVTFPFPGIPLATHLIGSVRAAVENLGAEFDYITTTMTKEEVRKFLAMEQDGWIGG